MTEFTVEQLRKQNEISTRLSQMANQEPTPAICLEDKDLMELFDACATELSPEVQDALSKGSVDLMVNGGMFKGVTQLGMLQVKAGHLASMLDTRFLKTKQEGQN